MTCWSFIAVFIRKILAWVVNAIDNLCDSWGVVGKGGGRGMKERERGKLNSDSSI